MYASGSLRAASACHSIAFGNPVQSRVGQSQVALRFEIPRFERQATLKSQNRVFKSVFGVLGASQEVPGLRIMGIFLDGTSQPFAGIGIAPQQHVIERHDF